MEYTEHSFETRDDFRRRLVGLLASATAETVEIEGAYECRLDGGETTFDVEISRVVESSPRE